MYYQEFEIWADAIARELDPAAGERMPHDTTLAHWYNLGMGVQQAAHRCRELSAEDMPAWAAQ